MTDRSLIGLNWLNLLVALMQTGFGAFRSVFLTTHGWNRAAVASDPGLLTFGARQPARLDKAAGDAAPSRHPYR